MVLQGICLYTGPNYTVYLGYILCIPLKSHLLLEKIKLFFQRGQ